MKHLLVLLTAATSWAAGPLTPPGAPAPTMKTLDQIEARTPIESLPSTISSSGSYYLTGNLEFSHATGDAITIGADNVTLDLNGFTLRSTPNVTGDAIKVLDNRNNIVIRNGNIVGNTTVTVSGDAPRTWDSTSAGFDNGIYANANASGGPRNLSVEWIQVRGCRRDGILAYSASVMNCKASRNGSDGITCSLGDVMNCSAHFNKSNGIECFQACVVNCVFSSNGSDGISAAYSTVKNCVADSNRTGMDVYLSSVVTDCAINQNDLRGIFVRESTLTNCTIVNNGAMGIEAERSTITNCGVQSNQSGILSSESQITGCRSLDNGRSGIVTSVGVVTSCVARGNNPTSIPDEYDLKATDSVVAFTKYGTGDTTGSTLTGNLSP